MNKQQLFNRAYSGLEKQGRLARNALGSCFFSNKRYPGITCAIGQMLTLEQQMQFQAHDVGAICSHDQELLFEVFGPEVDINFLSDVQKAHDIADTLAQALVNLQTVASHYLGKVIHEDEFGITIQFEDTPMPFQLPEGRQIQNGLTYTILYSEGTD